MRNSALFVFAFCLFSGVLSCNKDEGADPATEAVVKPLNEELKPLSADPIEWSNDEMKFLDAVSNNTIVGLGEATHGTSEFFKAKHRMLKYLVENHGFRIFAIEADFAESIYINDAVMSSNKGQIVTLMKSKMHFWTWKTDEVRDMLYWMCDYNLGKSDSEKVQYWGVDCQFLRDHPDLIKEELVIANVPFLAFADQVFAEIKSGSGDRFSGYEQQAFDEYLGNVISLKDSLLKYEAMITAASSPKQFQRTLQLVEVLKQSSEVMFYGGGTKNYRDEYMAANSGWLHDYFGGAKVVLWAHNGHVAYHAGFGSLGYHLKTNFPDQYATIGFLFSKGTFKAITQVGNQYQGLQTQSLEADPKKGSMNDMMHHANSDVFFITIADLQSHQEWNAAFLNGIEFFDIGAVYNNKPTDYYYPFKVEYFDHLIYVDRTTAASQVK